jgi:hypothetical protein
VTATKTSAHKPTRKGKSEEGFATNPPVKKIINKKVKVNFFQD